MIIKSGTDEAVQLAKSADKAIVFVGNNPYINGRETETGKILHSLRPRKIC